MASREKQREWSRKWREKNVEKARENFREWRCNNPEKAKAAVRAWEQSHREYLALKQRERREELRKLVMNIYGNGKCVLCGETDIKKLTLDHLHYDGGEFRRFFKQHGKTMLGCHFYRWLRRRGFPTNLGLRVLCKSCNSREANRHKSTKGKAA